MTRLGIRLDDVPATIGWHHLYIFTNNLPTDCALFRSKYPEYAAFATLLQQNAILARIADELAWLKFDFDSVHTKDSSGLKKPKPFLTPWRDDAEDGMERYGKGSAIAVGEFWDWYFGEDNDDGEETIDG